MAQKLGKVLSVDTRNLTENTITDAAVGDTVLYLTDAGPFYAGGGTVMLEGTSTAYADVDFDNDRLLLAAPLTVAYPTDSRVEVYPATPEKYATVDFGGEGEALPVLVPHFLVELMPDGVRDPADQETVTVDVNGYVLSIADVLGRDLPTGAIDSDRLDVGVVKNLVQDPQFLTGLRTVAAPWSVLGPDATYTESNYLRCTGAGILTDFYLADNIPVEPGTNIAFSALVRPTGVPTTATALIRAEFIAPDGTRLSGPNQIAESSVTDLPLGVWSTIAGTFTVPAGYVSVALRYGTTGVTTGTVDFIKPLAQALWSTVQSGNYVPGESGWSWSDTDAQAQGLNVIGELGAGKVSAQALSIAGTDLATLLDNLPKGLMQFGRAATTTNTAEVSAETILWEFNAGPVKAGRAYELTVHGHADGTAASIDAVFDFLIKYTGDGTAPTLSSGIMDGTLTKFPVPHVYPRDAFEVRCTYLPQQDYPKIRAALCLRRESGSGTMHVTVTDINRGLEFRMTDLGKFSGVLTGSLSQKSKATGTPDGDPSTTFMQEFKTTWAQSYNGPDATTPNIQRPSGTPANLEVGYNGIKNGRSLALFGFNDAAIRSALIGVTPTKIELVFRVKTSSSSQGLYINLLSTNLSAAPASAADQTGWTYDRFGSAPGRYAEGSTYSIELLLAMANEFKSGATRSLGLYAQNTSEPWGTFYGDTSTYEPTLRITGTY